MGRRPIHWINTPVLMEAIFRYEQGLLPKSMRLWVEAMLELPPQKSPHLLSK